MTNDELRVIIGHDADPFQIMKLERILELLSNDECLELRITVPTDEGPGADRGDLELQKINPCLFLKDSIPYHGT